MKKNTIGMRLTVAAALSLIVSACNPSVESASKDFNTLPSAVQKTARAQAPELEIVNVSKATRDGLEHYEITFKQGDQRPKVVVAADGNLVSTEMANPAGPVQRLLTPTGAAGTPLSALPVAVQKAVQDRAPDAKITGISREEENNRTIYRIDFAQSGTDSSLRVAEDGTVVQELQPKAR